MDSGKKRVAFIIIAAVGFLFTVLMGLVPASLSLVALVLAILALAASVLAFAAKDYYYMFNPIVRMKHMTAVIDSGEPFYMSPNGNSIIVRDENEVYATSFIKVPVYSSSTEMSDEEKLNFTSLFARLVSISKNPIRLSSQLNSINKDEYMSRITAKLNESEQRYNTLQNDKATPAKELDRVKGEVTMWRNMFDNVSRSNSQELNLYASITAVGNTEDEAINLSSLRAEEVAAGISATLGVTATIATGNDILVFIEPDYMIPPATITEMMKYKSGQAE